MANTKLCYPTVETWFIVWDDTRENILSYGSIEPNQCMETKWSEVDYYENEAEWIDVLLDNGINPFPPEIKKEDYDVVEVLEN